jgi:ferritin
MSSQIQPVTAMLPAPSVQKALNEQIKSEMQAHYNYLGMSAHFQNTAYLGFAEWMRVQSTEEYGHAMKIFDYLHNRDVTIELAAIDAPKTSFSSRPIEVFEASLVQEQSVTRQINGLYDLALREKDFATLEFLMWFLQEQVEEERTVTDLVDRLRLAGDNAAALLRLDSEAQRRAVRPATGGKPPA